MDKVNHILFVSVSEESDSEGLKQAISLAKSNLAKLSVIVCIDDLRKLNHQNNLILIQDMLDQKRDELKTYIKGFTDDEIKINVTLGKPFIEIIREVIENNVDLVIKPIDPIGFKSIVFGSQDLKLLRFCPCPLWLIKSTEQIGEKQIVVAIDYEPDNHENELLNIQLLKIGVSLALSQFAELHIVHAWKLEHENFYRSHRINYTHEEF